MKQDDDIERGKRFPWKSSLRRPMAGPSSLILVALVALIYLAAFASSAVVFVGAKQLFPSRMAIPFR